MDYFMFSLIAAVDLNRGIGLKGALPWRLIRDRQFFKILTTSKEPVSVQREFGIIPLKQEPSPFSPSEPDDQAAQRINAVIMGRKTWDSLPDAFRPLPLRYNVILSRNDDVKSGPGFYFSKSFEEALRIVSRREIGNIYVIGGASIFRLAVNHPGCKRIYLTEIMHEFGCDVFFPELTEHYLEIGCSEFLEEKSIRFRFKIFLKR
jgi:dihydrofolate reductase